MSVKVVSVTFYVGAVSNICFEDDDKKFTVYS